MPRTSTPSTFDLLAAPVIAATVSLIAWGIADGSWSKVPWWAVISWCAFSAAANLLPVPAGPHVYLSMSAPVNIAVAVVFPVPVAATVVALGSFSEFEISRKTTPQRAAYNRAQLGLSAGAAGAFLHLRPSPEIWTVAAAIAAYHLTNWCLVVTAVRAADGTPTRRVFARVLPNSLVAGLTYLALGAMGVAIGLAYQRIGEWAVAVLLIPLIGARQAVRAAHDIEKAERERRVISERLVDERTRERLRIATDLHDVVLQDLASLQVQADNVAVAAQRDDQRIIALARRLRSDLDTAISDVRAAITNLRRLESAEEGLVSALERFASAFSRQSGLEVELESDESSRYPTPDALSLVLYECCQELLTNVARHAQASRVTIRLTRTGDEQQIEVTDDGVGISMTESPSGQGLALSRERLASWGGAVWINTSSGGTAVVVRVPLGVADRS